jgi:hypothetical protein
LFCFFELLGRGTSQTEVPIEVVIIDEVGLYGLQINQYIVKLLQNEEALSHALSAWNGVTLRRRSTHHLEEVLCNTKMLLLL